MSSTRRAQAKVSMKADGVVYLLHFHERLGNERHSIQHYIGFTPDLEARLEKHREGRGARVTEVLKERGIGFDVVAVWPGNRQIENALKLHGATRICPTCTPSPRLPQVVQKAVEAEQRRKAREVRRDRKAQRAADAAAPVQVAPYERGAAMARQFMRQQLAVGRTADQIEATHAYITGPWREMTRHSDAQVEQYRGYSDVIAAALANLREVVPAETQAEAEAEAGA